MYQKLFSVFTILIFSLLIIFSGCKSDSDKDIVETEIEPPTNKKLVEKKELTIPKKDTPTGCQDTSQFKNYLSQGVSTDNFEFIKKLDSHCLSPFLDFLFNEATSSSEKNQFINLFHAINSISCMSDGSLTTELEIRAISFFKSLPREFTSEIELFKHECLIEELFLAIDSSYDLDTESFILLLKEKGYNLPFVENLRKELSKQEKIMYGN